MSEFAVGQQVRITGQFVTLPDDDPTDPDTVTLYIQSPTGDKMQLTISNGVVRDGTGAYHYDLLLTDAGEWYRAWVASGSGACAEVDQLMPVASSRVR